MGVGTVQHSFSGHETFPFRYPWLKKGFDAVRENGNVFLDDDAITTLGVGKNMVRSIRHWCLTAGVVEENTVERGGALRGSELGKLLLADDGLDPYLRQVHGGWLGDVHEIFDETAGLPAPCRVGGLEQDAFNRL